MKIKTEYEMEDSFKEHRDILWLDSCDREEYVEVIRRELESSLVGGKASNLSKLAEEGIKIPQGFCITTKAFDYFLEFNNIFPGEIIDASRIRKSVMPPFLVEIICEAYDQFLHNGPVAVRSSSPFEDLKSASFAGQYQSFLNVNGVNSLLEAIKECWISLWSPHVIDYRKQMGIGNISLKMAVLVQEMIPASASGVMFTGKHTTIEAMWGLGDILVGGKITPDHYVIDRTSRHILRRRISEKQKMSKIDSVNGMKIVNVPPDLLSKSVLTDDQLQTICVQGTTIETIFGCPQDIEWALVHDTIVILQARPISTSRKQPIWSRANIAETQPGYVTYLSRIPDNRPDPIMMGLSPLLECFGLKEIPEDIHFTDYIYGHSYLNMTSVYELLENIPGLSHDVLNQSLGHTDHEESDQTTDLDLASMIKLLPGTLRILRFFLRLPDKAKEVISTSSALIQSIQGIPLQSMKLDALDKLAWDIYDSTMRVFQIHSVTALAAMSFFGFLQKITNKIAEEGTENVLTIGLEGMSSSQLGIELWNLARRVSQTPAVEEILTKQEYEFMEQHLQQIPEGRTFLNDLDEFLGKYGDRCSQELELSIPRWGENPQFILRMVVMYLNTDLNPQTAFEKQKALRIETTAQILKSLSHNPVEKILFEKILSKTQEFIVLRENLKTAWVKGYAALRDIYLRIGSQLTEKGLLSKSEDIFYLKMEEVTDVIQGEIPLVSIQSLLQYRKREKKEYEHVQVPEVIHGNPPPLHDAPDDVNADMKLEGIGCSQGYVTGRARVIEDPTECQGVRKGEILVTHITDPGWSPLFVAAGGLIMELGGTLSHGVIIAREYGIPAVVGVKNATKVIQTGQLITLDGTHGTISIIDESKSM